MNHGATEPKPATNINHEATEPKLSEKDIYMAHIKHHHDNLISSVFQRPNNERHQAEALP